MAPDLTALRCLFLVAMHHGLHLAPEELPDAQGQDLLPAMLGAMRRAGLKARAVTGCGWDKAARMPMWRRTTAHQTASAPRRISPRASGESQAAGCAWATCHRISAATRWAS